MLKKETTLSEQCDEIIKRHFLLDHPFYKAWSDGTLPVQALADYAGEYGSFIRTIGTGWETVGRADMAAGELSHFQMWERTFSQPLGSTSEQGPQIPEVEELVDTANVHFADRAAAIGALYAFEAQQPLTAKSKLEGLEKHYSQLPKSCGDYFKLHSNDYDEVSLLTEMMEGLDESAQNSVLAACESLSRALYSALSGIYAGHEHAC